MFMSAGLKPLLAMFDFRFLAVRNGVRPVPDPWDAKLSGLPRGSFSALQAKRRVFQESRSGFLQETRTTGPGVCSTGTCAYLESGKKSLQPRNLGGRGSLRVTAPSPLPSKEEKERGSVYERLARIVLCDVTPNLCNLHKYFYFMRRRRVSVFLLSVGRLRLLVGLGGGLVFSVIARSVEFAVYTYWM